MIKISYSWLLAGLVLGLSWQGGQGQELPKGHACEPGFPLVEEIRYKEVCREVCKPITEVKKKWVYCWKDDPFCLPKDGKKCCAHGAEGCPHGSCVGPFPRKQLVKKQVIDKVVTKCEVEKVVELVPYKVYRKVPCGQGVAPPAGGVPK